MTDHTQAPAPTGDMVLVPREPTRPMIAGALSVDWANEDEIGAAYNVWHAMLAAAPSPSASTMGVKELEWEHPTGAIINGRALLDRVETHYGFADIDEHRLGNCADWIEARRCFEAMAEALGQADFTRRVQSCQPSAGGEGTVEALREALQRALDLLREKIHGSRARSPGHNAQLELLRAIELLASLSPPKAETETASGEPLYLIRKGALFYRPNSQGYTASTVDAGRYTLAEAEAISHPNGPDGPRDGMDYIPAPAPTETTSERKRLVEALRRLAQGWANVIELGLLPAQHVATAQELHDAARAALAQEPAR